jgi:hypothetical protein
MKSDQDYFMADCHREQPYPERDKTIIAYFGCYHLKEAKTVWNQSPKCVICGEDVTWGNSNLSTPNGYFWLLDKVRTTPKLLRLLGENILETNRIFFDCPDTFADIMYEIIKDQK